MTTSDIYIVSTARTPMGSMQGAFSTVTAAELGAVAIEAALEKGGVSPESVDEVFMGNVLMAGQGQAPARQAALGAGIAQATPCTTLNKMCGSGLQALMTACDTLKAGRGDVIVAGGMESMTNAPYLLPKARSGMRMGHGQVIDSMMLDGLTDAYSEGTLMGHFADKTAEKYQFTREDQDAFALESLSRAKKAIEGGAFKAEIAPVTVKGRKGDTVVDTDEAPSKAMPEKIPSLRPAFNKDGTVTAANASSISDGAAVAVLCASEGLEKYGLKPVAKVLGYSSHAHEPEWFTTAPVQAMQKLMSSLNMSVKDFDLFEINEAFSVVTMAAMKEIGIPHDRVNVNGGAVALGHPIGASGARILTTLVHALKAAGKKRGIAALCIGGGEAVAMAVELV
ncbi:MAG: acetyl-CoA C-acyltransferase [Pseudomonadota bacterium]|nr:acetyl-CoA C-acyltransferase [Pseudomonadota bacterium]